MADNYRLLKETCQAAITILPCNLAWMLVNEDNMLRSKAILTEKGDSAAEVFLRLVAMGRAGDFVLPLTPGDNPISDAALTGARTISLQIDELLSKPGGEPLHRALKQLRFQYVHFVPLIANMSDPNGDLQIGSTIGIMVLAASWPHDMGSVRGGQILDALMNQCATVLEHVRLSAQLSEREEQMRAEQTFRKMILDTMADSLVVIDEGAVVRYANNRLLKISNYTRTELIGQSVGTLFHPEGREALVAALKRGSKHTLSFSQRLVTKDSRIVPVLMSRASAPMVDLPGAPPSTVLVLTDLTEQKRREEALLKQSERLRALNKAVQAITRCVTVEEVAGKVIAAATEVVGSRSACLLLRDGSDHEVYRVAVANGPEAIRLRNMAVRRGEGIAGEVAADHQARIVNGVQPSASGGVERAGSTVLAAPLMVSDFAIGILELFDKIEGQFTQEDQEFIENLAVAGSVAIENSRLFDQTNRRVGELSTILEASALASSTLEINNVLEMVTRRLREALNVARCSISTWDRQAKSLNVLAEACNAYWPNGTGPERTLGKIIFTTGTLTGGRPILGRLADERMDGRIRTQLQRQKMTSVMLMPVRFSQTLAGVVELYKTSTQPQFTALHLQVVEDIVRRWSERAGRSNGTDMLAHDLLTELCNQVMQAGRASWCVLSMWDRQERRARAIREIGIAVWDEKDAPQFPLESFPTMSTSLMHGMPMTFYAAMLREDAQENMQMTQSGTNTGLVTPLLVRGEANGLVKLLDIAPDRNFDLQEISLCMGIGSVIGNALENARLYQSLERRANALQSAYDDLRDADKLKDNLIQSLSHELKTPLHKISMALQLMEMEALGPLSEEQRESMKSLITWSTQLGNLVNNMMTLHSSEAGQMQFVETHMENIVTTALESVHKSNERINHKIVFSAEPNLPPIRADETKLVNCFAHLIENAIKFSPNADRVEIQAWDTGGALVNVCIQDHGIGIPASEYDRIFQKGYQIDGSTTRRFGGTGIGLAIVRSIIEAHGGKIWVESVVGQGSKFFVTLPRWLG